MGLANSGGLADAALYARAEENWATRASVQESHGVKLWTRFRDDILAIYDVEEGPTLDDRFPSSTWSS